MVGLRTKALKLGLKVIEPFQDSLNRIGLFKRTFQKVWDKFAPDEWMLVDVEGVKMYINPRDRAISRFIIQQGAYEIGTTKVFKRVIKKGMVVFDIGAHWGYYSLIAASLVGENGKGFAFEPHPLNYDLLLKSISFNGFSNISPIKKAVSDKNGIIKLFCSHKESAGHSIVLPENEDEYIEVETVTLDEFCKENKILPDVVKMDVEGAEPLALKGMKRMIERSENLKMFIEYVYNKEELFNFLSKYFDIYRITKDGQLVPLEEMEGAKDFEPNIYCERR